MITDVRMSGFIILKTVHVLKEYFNFLNFSLS